jgi:acylphosphatase
MAMVYIERMRTVRLLIGGRVQGVGYRAWAVRIASEFGLRGWVKNRRDGTVEMLISGPDDAVAAMIDAAKEGPPAARVGGVRIDDAEDDGSPDFTPRATE